MFFGAMASADPASCLAQGHWHFIDLLNWWSSNLKFQARQVTMPNKVYRQVQIKQLHIKNTECSKQFLVQKALSHVPGPKKSFPIKRHVFRLRSFTPKLCPKRVRPLELLANQTMIRAPGASGEAWGIVIKIWLFRFFEEFTTQLWRLC